MKLMMNAEQTTLLQRVRDTLGRLRETLALTAASDPDRKALADSIRQLDEMFLLVVAGEFNAGKSAFINALMGDTLQKEGVTPTTDQIYLLKYGETPSLVADERGVWVRTAPVDLLRKVSVVDTPGTNAIMREHEALTAEFIPRSDLVLFITSADRPFTQSESNFLSQIRDWGKKIVLIINKVDILQNDEAVTQVVDFVTQSANKLIGNVPAVFPLSAKLAQQGDADSGFAPLEAFIQETLDDNGRFRLKLLNPLGVGRKLVGQQLDAAQADLDILAEDTSLLDDIQRQMLVYDEDMQRHFKARLSEIDNTLYEMENRGNAFFDDRLRLARIPDLIRSKQLEKDYEDEVVANTPERIEELVSELIDWLVEQDLRQWTAVSDHITERSADYANRIVGQSGPREGTLAYDRRRLIDSIGVATRRAVATYDKDKEAMEMATAAKTAVVNTGLAGVGVGLGVTIAVVAHTAFLDFTGIFAGIAAAALGFLILPSRKRKAKQELSEKLTELREKLVSGLTEQFEREMRRSAQRIEDMIAPFTRFVRAEQGKLVAQRDDLEELEAHIAGLRVQLGERVE